MRKFISYSAWVGAYKFVHVHKHILAHSCSLWLHAPDPNIQFSGSSFSEPACYFMHRCSGRNNIICCFWKLSYGKRGVLFKGGVLCSSWVLLPVFDIILCYSCFPVTQDKRGTEIPWKTQIVQSWGEIAEWPFRTAKSSTTWTALC